MTEPGAPAETAESSWFLRGRTRIHDEGHAPPPHIHGHGPRGVPHGFLLRSPRSQFELRVAGPPPTVQSL
ncbi:hypothetical protein [Streptomyces sp. NPDC096142]|uniref:hypothetical protein n=1 Tax=Streptomyces sp. NPDC096142 TaxID=3366077 RepID=UPI00381B95E2